MRKILDLTFNINTDKKYNNKETQNFYNDDVNINTLRIQLMNEGNKINLTEMDMTPVLKIKSSDGTSWNNLTIIEVVPEHGVIQCNLPNDLVAHGGKFTGNVSLENELQSIHISKFIFTIKE